MNFGPQNLRAVFPCVRKDLIVTPIDDECLVYDPLSGKAHHLDASLTRALHACDGQTSLQQLTAEPEGALALATLSETELLQQSVPVDRRAALAAIGKAALMPAILSLVIPAPAAAVSGVTEQQCFAGGAAVCGQRCVDVLGQRVCAAVLGSGDPRCACVPLAAAANCLPTPCTPYP